jgi:hypothetical protein
MASRLAAGFLTKLDFTRRSMSSPCNAGRLSSIALPLTIIKQRPEKAMPNIRTVTRASCSRFGVTVALRCCSAPLFSTRRQKQVRVRRSAREYRCQAIVDGRDPEPECKPSRRTSQSQPIQTMNQTPLLCQVIVIPERNVGCMRDPESWLDDEKSAPGESLSVA